MTQRRLRTLVIGFGKVASGYAKDTVMSRYYPYATHSQVLADHPDFDWDAVVDMAREALESARSDWKIPAAVSSIAELPQGYEPDIAVLATPPQTRLEILEGLPTLQGVLVEKPLGLTLEDSRVFLNYCQRRNILVQVNYWRRADETFRAFAASKLVESIGQPQSVFGLYGNGLLNNGTHMVDFVRMLFGEIEQVQAVGGVVPYLAGPIGGDVNVPFILRLCSGLSVMIQPIKFECYRENSLDIWGEKARLSIMQEGLGILLYPRRENRAMQGEKEIASDQPQMIKSTVGRAFYQMYGNLAQAVRYGVSLWSSGESALQTERVIEAVRGSARRNGASVKVE